MPSCHSERSCLRRTQRRSPERSRRGGIPTTILSTIGILRYAQDDYLGSVAMTAYKQTNISYAGVTVRDLHVVSRLGDAFSQLLGDHHGAVPAAGAAEANGQIAFALMNVVRQ